MAGQYDKIKNYTVAVKERGRSIKFLRRIIPGGADRSYGLHETAHSLKEKGIRYDEVPLKNNTYDLEGIRYAAGKKPKVVLLQRSRGYSTRASLSLEDIQTIIAAVKKISPDTICFVDNCYGEFAAEQEPLEVGADIIAGSLIKNPGGGIAPTGGYIAGRADLVDAAADYLTAPGLGTELGSYAAGYRLFFQGIFSAPHVDAVQAFGYLPVYPQTDHIDLLSICSHKIYGPKGMGTLYIRKGIEISSEAYGGPQEHHLRAGTENVAGIVGFGAAAAILEKERQQRYDQARRLKKYMYETLSMNSAVFHLNGEWEHSLPNILDFSISGIDNAVLLIALDMQGVGVSAGSACEAGAVEPSHVDFNYEVSRSLAACEGALLVVDATQGVEAQTLANVYLAMEHDLEIVPIINKIDLPSADPERVAKEIEDIIGIDASEAILVSAKTGVGIEDVLEAIVQRVPEPEDAADAPLRALIFDSHFDSYKGAIANIRIVEGSLKTGERIKMMASEKVFEITELGIFAPQMRPVDSLECGSVGYLAASMRLDI